MYITTNDLDDTINKINKKETNFYVLVGRELLLLETENGDIPYKFKDEIEVSRYCDRMNEQYSDRYFQYFEAFNNIDLINK